jgi:HD-like signal output (HDOD) protein
MTADPSSREGPVVSGRQIAAQVLAHWQDIIRKIPMPPASFGNVLTYLHEDREPDDWVAIVRTDPVLSAKVLAVVNSAAMGLTKPMTDLRRAIVHLGSHITRVIVLAYFVEGLLGKWDHYPRQHFEFIRRWSAGASIIAYHFACCAKLAEPGTLSTAALLSRLGSFVLALEWPGPQPDYAQQHSELARLDYELKIWRITSPILGRLTAEHWGLPEPLPTLIERHLEALYQALPEDEDSPELALLGSAIVLAAHTAADPELKLDDVLYTEENFQLLENIKACNLLDVIAGCWDLNRLRTELAAVME